MDLDKFRARVANLPLTRQQLERQRAQTPPATKAVAVLDSAGYADAEMRIGAAGVVQAWATTPVSDLEEGETLQDRLIAMIVESAAPDAGDDLTPDQEDIATAHLNFAAEYMLSKGVAGPDVSAMIDDGNAEAAGRVHEYLSGEFSADPSEDDLSDLHNYAFSAAENESVFDSAAHVLDAVYKNTAVVHGGKKLLVRRRVSGTVRRTGAQKVALKKAQMRSHGSGAKLARAKSMRQRKQMGL